MERTQVVSLTNLQLSDTQGKWPLHTHQIYQASVQDTTAFLTVPLMQRRVCSVYSFSLVRFRLLQSSRKQSTPRHTFFFSQRPTRTSSPDHWVSDSPAANNTVLCLKEGTSASQI